MKVRQDLDQFLVTLPSDVTLVAATKYVDTKELETLLTFGVNNFGENRVDSFLEKYEVLKDKNVTWHFIGHLQRNKAKLIANKIDYLHSLDSLELAKLLSKERTSPLKCFVEVSINKEESKNGINPEDTIEFIKEASKLENIEIVGLMMMSIKGSKDNSLENQFHKLVMLKDEVERSLNIKLPYLSMGMSDDYKIAIQGGATHIRLGRILFTE